MKNILKIIWGFINSKFFGYAVIALLILFLAGQCKHSSDLKRDNKIKDQNIAAADSTINEYKTKEGKYTAEKAVWILTEKDLKKQNKDLYDKVESQSGKIISLNNAVLHLRQDTSMLHDSIRYLKAIIGKAGDLGDGNWNIPWELYYTWDKNNFDIFKGHSVVYVDSITKKVTHKNTLMDFRESNIDLVFGEKVVDGKFNVYATTTYPGLSIKSLEGYFIDPNSNKNIKGLIEKNHWFTGFGVGPTFNIGYDFLHNQPAIIVGAGIRYNFYQW